MLLLEGSVQRLALGGANWAFSWGLSGVTFSVDPKSDVGTSGDLAWESGTYAVKAKSGASVEIGKYLTVYKKSGGKWLIIRDTWNSDAPPAPPSPASVTPAKK